jgi:hypothetical protein
VALENQSWQKEGRLMDAGTMKDYIEDLIQQVTLLEEHFRKLNAVIVELQEQRDQYRRMYEALLD